jgi:predicted glycosyltransferase involved in capsule biosynthesis
VVHSIQSYFLPRRDQSLFITKELFEEIKGFDEKFIIYEDNEIISRL